MGVDSIISFHSIRHHQGEHEDDAAHESEGLRYGFVLTVNL